MTSSDDAQGLMRIDAHHHLWRYDADGHDWLQGDLACLRRDFTPVDLLHEMASAGVAGAVAVQARQSELETEWLLQIASEHRQILGVVGWLPIASDALGRALDRFASHPKLKGLRHVVQAEPAGFLDGDDFNRGIERLSGTGLVYDLLLHEHQLTEATRFVDRHPGQAFVLDHLAKPRIAAQEMEPWKSNLRELARRPNVTCKLSGMVTEAGHGWKPDLLKRYFEVVLDAFGPSRIMVGTDWPVLTAHCTYRQWWQVVEDWMQPLSRSEQADMMGLTAVRTYHLEPASP